MGGLVGSMLGLVNRMLDSANSTLGLVNSTLDSANRTLGLVNSTLGLVNSTLGLVDSMLGLVHRSPMFCFISLICGSFCASFFHSRPIRIARLNKGGTPHKITLSRGA